MGSHTTLADTAWYIQHVARTVLDMLNSNVGEDSAWKFMAEMIQIDAGLCESKVHQRCEKQERRAARGAGTTKKKTETEKVESHCSACCRSTAYVQAEYCEIGVRAVPSSSASTALRAAASGRRDLSALHVDRLLRVRLGDAHTSTREHTADMSSAARCRILIPPCCVASSVLPVHTLVGCGCDAMVFLISAAIVRKAFST